MIPLPISKFGVIMLVGLTLWVGPGLAQSRTAAQKAAAHQWCHEPSRALPDGVSHHRFRSLAMKREVGYSLYLPPNYAEDSTTRYPVIYWLHGGGGDELTGVPALAPHAQHAINDGKIPPVIIVFINGGAAWHYDNPKTNQLGETAFIKELIPLIDRSYRTIADRNHRAIEGMSMGGRGTTRNIFKYPELFCSAVAVSPGIGNEQVGVEAGQHQENNVFALLEKYARDQSPSVRFMLIIGTEDQNYPSNLLYMDLLTQRDVPYQAVVIPGVRHSNAEYYAQLKASTLAFHAESFRRAVMP